MRTRPRRIAIAVSVLTSTVFMLVGCAGFFDRYPNAETEADLVGSWTHDAGRLALNADGSFEMSNFPRWVALGDSSMSSSAETVTCSGTWTFYGATQNFWLSSTEADCGGGGFATGRQDEMTIAFGIDSGTGDPRCFEFVREGSTLTPRGYEECLQYN